MKAVVVVSPGTPSALELAEVERPDPGEHDVVIAVAAAGVNRADVLQRKGHYPSPEGAPHWPGLEVSGTVTWAGDHSGHAVGDEVCALLPGGGYAEEVVVNGSLALPIPERVGLVDAAGLMETVCTVWSNVFLLAALRAGETLLVHGGSSGVGTMAVQLGRAFGATVAVTASSSEKLAACRGLGADILIDYTMEDFVERMTSEGGADVVLDLVGGSYLARNIAALRVNGRIANIASAGSGPAELDFGALMRKRGTIRSTSLRARPLAERAEIVASVAENVWPLFESGAVRPVTGARFPLADAAEAHRLMESSSHIGKILLTT
ncbi:NAD(P)H quinone oxidoreductase [Cnuibacter physcomitrellae]|uniref:NADPH:quinone oxidoreductase n=1 Tax=Cnuibacter physcomitrellae TaxID=1619308 RepID=A0A1X9LM81_9MICO|nr:NAD(P)H-quinone oxidoreductase [Cnuibacter physcomitrellae]ARJ05051.1 NADPH:quinone oxidoreductase [Cnuibacter physcomitrellae]GGI34843.1 NAD(P)H quinone oxidoreductase [Cnuibacter physcomitrellae]